MTCRPHYITVQKQSSTVDSAGEQIDQWTTFVNLFVSVVPVENLGKNEFEIVKQMYSETTHRIDSWYTPGVTTAMRIKFADRTFNILQVVNVKERGNYMTIICREITG